MFKQPSAGEELKPIRVLLVEGSTGKPAPMAPEWDVRRVEGIGTAAGVWKESAGREGVDVVVVNLGEEELTEERMAELSGEGGLLRETGGVLLAGGVDGKFWRGGFGSGAGDCLRNPVEFEEMRARVEKAAERERERKRAWEGVEELRARREEAETAARMKADFLATMSHEIRTPMNGVIAMATMLLESQLSQEQAAYAETIRSSGEVLLNLINDILDYSKIESGKLEFRNEPFDLQGCVEESLQILGAEAARKGLEMAHIIEEDVPSGIVGDSNRLRQILINLLSNAIKFTSRGEVVLEIRMKEGGAGEKGEMLHFSVRDTGVGIPENKLDRLFKSFSQADASIAFQYGGTGLGLSISRQLTELMGGRMWVESEEGRGSTFHFTAPSLRAPLTGHDQKMKEFQASGLRALLLAKPGCGGKSLASTVKRTGIGVTAVSEAREAMQVLQGREVVHAILLDAEAPSLDPALFLKEARALPARRAVPAYLLVASGAKAPGAGAGTMFAGCFQKPLRQSQLREALAPFILAQAKPPVPKLVRTRLDTRLGQKNPLKILLAEDNLVNQKVATCLLEQMGYAAKVVPNGSEAQKLTRTEAFDLVLMDILMPEMDGMEATRQIRQWEKKEGRAAGIVIVAVTANAMPGDREKYLAAGMDDYLAKPIQPEQLEKLLMRWSQTILERAKAVAAPVSGGCSGAGAGGGAGTAAAGDPAPSAADAGKRPPVDLERMREISGGGPEDMRELVELYLDQTSGHFEKLKAALARGAALEARNVAHTCAGASFQCGIRSVGIPLQGIERIAEKGSVEGAAVLFQQAQAEMERVRLFLTEYLNPSSVATQTTHDRN